MDDDIDYPRYKCQCGKAFGCYSSFKMHLEECSEEIGEREATNES